MGKKSRRAQPREILGIMHNRQGPFLYGCILFFKYTPGGPSVEPYDQSAPFTVAETLGPDEEVVYGSVDFLIRDISRLVGSVYDQIEGNNAALGHVPPARVTQDERAILYQVPKGHYRRRTHFEFKRRLTGTLILISNQARNLFQLFPRLDRTIDLFDDTGKRTGDISLTKLFSHFIHNRYLFLDGEHVADLFPAEPRRGSSKGPIAQTFMGYRFNWIEYIELIDSAIRDVKLRDFTGLLRGRLKKLSLESPRSDIVFLVQNLYSFSKLFEAMPAGTQRYGSILHLLLAGELKELLASVKPIPGVSDRVQFGVAFDAPRITIHEDLSERKFRVSVRCKWSLRDRRGSTIHEDTEFEQLSVEVGYEKLLDRVNEVFGNDLLLDFRP